MTTSRSVRVAAALWTAWAIVVWNVVFDQVIALAGRRYIVAAVAAEQGSGPYARIDDWMHPAVTRGFWLATAAAGVILLIGVASVALAGRQPRPS